MQPKDAVLPLTLFLILISLVTYSAKAETENITVPPESEFTRTLDLQNDDRVAIGFTVVGQSVVR